MVRARAGKLFRTLVLASPFIYSPSPLAQTAPPPPAIPSPSSPPQPPEHQPSPPTELPAPSSPLQPPVHQLPTPSPPPLDTLVETDEDPALTNARSPNLAHRSPYSHTTFQQPDSLFFGIQSAQSGPQLARLAVKTENEALVAAEFQRNPQSDDQIRAGFQTTFFGPVAFQSFGRTTPDISSSTEGGGLLLYDPFRDTQLRTGATYLENNLYGLLEGRYIGHRAGGLQADLQLIANPNQLHTRGVTAWTYKGFFISASTTGEGNYRSSQGWLLDDALREDSSSIPPSARFGIFNQLYKSQNGPEGFHMRLAPKLSYSTLDALSFDIRSSHVGDFVPIQEWPRPFADFLSGSWGLEAGAQRNQILDTANLQLIFWKDMVPHKLTSSQAPGLHFWGLGAEYSHSPNCQRYWGIFDMAASYNIFSAETRISFDIENNDFAGLIFFATQYGF